MKRTTSIFILALALIALYGCHAAKKQPLLMCDLADLHKRAEIAIVLHGQDGDRSCTISTDDYGMFSYSPEFPGELAEMEFRYDGRGYGAVLQKRKHVKLVIVNGDPVFSCDNKECNETCEAIRRIFGKDNFIHTAESPASYEEKNEQLRHSMQEVRQYIATVSDTDLRERLTRRLERLHHEYAEAIGILREGEDREEYNRHIGGISLHDTNLYYNSPSAGHLYSSTD